MRVFIPAFFLAIAACTPETRDPGQVMQAREGVCFAVDETPAQFETVVVTVEVAPGIYETRREQRETQARQPIRFRTPCPEDLTPALISSVERALAARGAYDGAASGQMSSGLSRAIRRYQEGFGLNSATLSLEAAQRLGLISLTPDQLAAADRGEGSPFSAPSAR